MSDNEERRVVFYSKTDMSAWWNLQNAQKLLDNIDLNQDFSINDCLEFYNITKYFDNEIFLNKWTEDEKENYINISKQLYQKCIIFFKGIDSQNILDYIEELDFSYDSCFWELIDKCKVYENFSSKELQEILNKNPHHISNILKHKKLVGNFKEEIRVFLLGYVRSWNILLDYAKENWRWFPKDLLNDEDKETILLKYIEWNEDTLPNLERIPKLQDGFLRLSWTTKLLAKKKHQEKIHELFSGNGNTFKYWYNIGLSKDQIEPFKVEQSKEGLPSITYSVEYFDSLDLLKGPLDIFSSTFGFLDKKWLIDLVSKDSEVSAMEWVFSHWEDNDYKVSFHFNMKYMQSIWNLNILQTYLREYRDIFIEDIVNNFINERLKKWEGFKDLDFQLDTYEIPYQDKITSLFRKLDFFIKQYRCFVTEWKIDFELIGIDTRPVTYNWIPSLLPEKYFYEKDDKLSMLKYHFYSDQSWLFYIPWSEGKYNSFFSLITNKNLKLDDFSYDHQKEVINYLIQEWYLELTEGGFIKIKDMTFIFLVGEIHREWVLSYYAYTDEFRNKIDEMKGNGLLFSESTLLSTQESNYFDYYLNNSKFRNWPAIRNKNSHWHRYESEDQASSDYLVSLKMVILILLKIEQELLLKSKFE